MNRRFWLSTAAYLVITFGLAVLWHVVAFGDTYRRLGFFGREEPLFAMGFLAILVQGLLLAWAYPRLDVGERTGSARAGRFAAWAGVFLWSAHVLAAAAKNRIEPLVEFIPLETAYLTVNFALYAVALTIIHRDRT